MNGRSITTLATAAILAAGTTTGIVAGATYVEDFEGGGGAAFDPHFNHFIHAFDDPMQNGFWEVSDDETGDYVQWLYPATNEVTFQLDPCERVTEATVTLADFCGIGCTTVRFVGTTGTADFGNTVSGSEQMFSTAGLGLGDILRIEMTSFEGYFDDIVIETMYCPGDVDGDGVVAFSDILFILANWGSCP